MGDQVETCWFTAKWLLLMLASIAANAPCNMFNELLVVSARLTAANAVLKPGNCSLTCSIDLII